MAKVITIKNIQPKPYKRAGRIYQEKQVNIYHTDITHNKLIRLYGTQLRHKNAPIEFDKTFKIGDNAEYDSYNLSFGQITSISHKTITIATHRLDLHTFAWRNWDFDIEFFLK